jgi:hypothetical protein
MNFDEFMVLTNKRRLLCGKELKCEVPSRPDRLIYFCPCFDMTAIFKDNNTKPLLYYSCTNIFIGYHLQISRGNETLQFIVAASSSNQHITFFSNHIKSWLQTGDKIKDKIDSLLVLK